MKKLMFAATVAVCGSLFAVGISSSNIVGYQYGATVGGFNCIGAAFNTVGGADYAINNFKPVDSDGVVVGGWTCYISKMTTEGATDTDTTAVWMTVDDGVEADGWYDANDGETPKPLTFVAGEGFMLDGVEGGLMSSGEVNLGSTKVGTVGGFNALCNPKPVEISINEIVPYDEDGAVVGGWTCYISKMTTEGATDTDTTAVWMTVDDGVEADGWYDANDGETPKPLTFVAGEGFMLDGVDGQIEFKAKAL